MPIPPLCPITQEPAARFVQTVSAKLLVGLWKYGGVDLGAALLPYGRFHLWESRTGLMFFDPPVAGDADFYRDFYAHVDAHERLGGKGEVRHEFKMAAAHIGAGERVLDVGCGLGRFRNYVPQALYTGLDPNFGGDGKADHVLCETIEQHAETHAGQYDAVCAFQVIEHVVDPLATASAMVRCLKPGGKLILGVPCWPSPISTIPNFIVNAPPHHLTWWSEAALHALAGVVGLPSSTVELVPVSGHESIMYWMAKVSPVKCRRDRFFAAKKTWYAALAISYGVGRVLDAILPLPKRTGHCALLLVAQRA